MSSRLWMVLAGVLPLVLAEACSAGEEPPASPPDYRIAFWYLRADPVNSFKFEVYDVRKGEYTRAVDDWLETMRTKHPAYAAYVKELRVGIESVATVVLREFVGLGGLSGGYGSLDRSPIYGGGLERLVSPGRSLSQSERERSWGASAYVRGYGFVASPGANRPPSYLSSPGRGPSMPFPYPYVRPHP